MQQPAHADRKHHISPRHAAFASSAAVLPAAPRKFTVDRTHPHLGSSCTAGCGPPAEPAMPVEPAESKSPASFFSCASPCSGSPTGCSAPWRRAPRSSRSGGPDDRTRPHGKDAPGRERPGGAAGGGHAPAPPPRPGRSAPVWSRGGEGDGDGDGGALGIGGDVQVVGQLLHHPQAASALGSGRGAGGRSGSPAGEARALIGYPAVQGAAVFMHRQHSVAAAVQDGVGRHLVDREHELLAALRGQSCISGPCADPGP